MKNSTLLASALGLIGGIFTGLFGGWTTGMVTLLIFMGVDYISGLIVAGVFQNSTKSENGALESRAGFKGLCRKCMVLVFVMVAYRLDLMISTNYIRDAVVITFTINEVISIAENAALMGIPLPEVIMKALDIMKQRASFEEERKR